MSLDRPSPSVRADGRVKLPRLGNALLGRSRRCAPPEEHLHDDGAEQVLGLAGLEVADGLLDVLHHAPAEGGPLEQAAVAPHPLRHASAVRCTDVRLQGTCRVLAQGAAWRALAGTTRAVPFLAHWFRILPKRNKFKQLPGVVTR
eukprot:CAMPEP_0179267458 /NCGR_PEP_ID=MMETSP0797-20121207/29938_1 /TAXON_ID=47934 /ORGANISM="Dinophysis acuminata, Strain DAEP01" /LENGTH=144 /DNA_ID=CAMNT_0020975715 /DNA_START=693 /DNA_END=1124 /DNA_ORIENTATION=+